MPSTFCNLRPRSRVRRLLPALAIAGLCAPAAVADEAACHASYVEVQRLQRSAQLLAARRQAIACGQDECSPTVRADCAEWLASIAKALPSIVIDARDAGSHTLADVRVEVDGEPRVERLDGRAIELDPGEHRLSFVHAGQRREQHALIREGEKYRPIEVRFGSVGRAGPEPASEASAEREPAVRAGASGEVPVVSYALGGVGLMGLGVFGALAIQGYESERELRQSCRGACAERDVRAVRRQYLAADVGLGVGVAALATALSLWYWSTPEPDSAGSAPAPTRRLAVGPRGFSWSGAF